MAFSGGSFSLYIPGNPVITGTTISSSWANNTLQDVANGLSTCVLKDGSQSITANIPLGGFKITGLGAATARTDAASIATIQDGTGVYVGTVGGTADVITLTPSPAIATYVQGQTFRWLASGTNTGPVTVQVSGIAVPLALTKNGTTALVAGDLPSGAVVTATMDGTGFQITSVGLGTFVASSIFAAAGYTAVGTGAGTVAGLPPTANVVANATTSNIWTAPNVVLTGGAVTFTDVADAPYVGAVSYVYQNAAHIWTNGANFVIQGAANVTAVAGDILKVEATAAVGGPFTVSVVRGNGESVGGPNQQTFSTAGANTWNKPTGFPPGALAFIQNWAAGASGGKGSANKPSGGGGGGAYSERWVLLSTLGSSETVTIGAGGAAQTVADTAGNAGGNTTFGAHLTAYGGGAGAADTNGGGGGGGGGVLGAGTSSTTGAGGRGGSPSVPAATAEFSALGQGTPGDGTNYRDGGPNQFGGGGGAAALASVGGKGGTSAWGGGGGGGGTDGAGTATVNAGGSSLWGGGGGGGAANSVAGGSAGTSVYGGNGSAGTIDANASAAGTQPGGGSGGTEGGDSGKGGDGRCIVTVIN